MAPLAPAYGQNLDAGKPASQIFAEVCANCHRSPRELRSNPGASFLREHYTTGSEMASTMAAYLSSGSDSRGPGAAQPRRPPAAITPPGSIPAGAAPTRDTADPSREPRRAAQQGSDPKAAQALPGSTRGRPASARAEAIKPEAAVETKPPAPSPPPPPKPVLEEFEE